MLRWYTTKPSIAYTQYTHKKNEKNLNKYELNLIKNIFIRKISIVECM